ncbi:hypothetical protein HYU15_02990 [Candidatus Woesearchaeota archaeon]|nr:hypothetical protein [Candidatus Woesearchaeota archaeon]
MAPTNAPTTLDVHVEMLHRAGEGALSVAHGAKGLVTSAPSAVSTVARNGGRLLGYTSLAALVHFVGLNVLPTVVRWGSENARQNHDDLAKCLGIYIGGFAGSAAMVRAYYHLATNQHPEVLWIPAVTNAASLLFEVGRAYSRAYARTRQDLVQGRSPDSA